MDNSKAQNDIQLLSCKVSDQVRVISGQKQAEMQLREQIQLQLTENEKTQ